MKSKITEILKLYKISGVHEVPTGHCYVFSNIKGNYLEIIVFGGGNEVRYIDDNYPLPRKIFSSNIPVMTIEEFESDLIRMGIEIPNKL